MRLSGYKKKICYFSSVVLIIIFFFYIPDSKSSHSTGASFEDGLISQLLARYSQSYETPSDACNTEKPLDDETMQAFQHMSKKLKELHSQILPYPKEYFHGQGIVLTGGMQQLMHAKANLKLIEHSGTRLPVQVWYSKEQTSTEIMMDLLRFVPNLNASVCCFVAAECRSLTKVWQLNTNYIYKPFYDYVAGKAFPYKPAAILSATFAEVLFLDCDAYVTRDPHPLFLSDPMYLKFGALFFPDAMKSRQHPAMWKFLGLSCAQDEYEFESSMILVNKRKVWNGLYMAKVMNDHPNSFYKYTDGDKDTFRIGFRYMKVRYYLVTTPCSTGSFHEGLFCGYTLCKADSLTRHIYVNHVHLFKYNDRPYAREYLDYIRIGIGTPNDKSFSFQHCQLSNAHQHCFHIIKESMTPGVCHNGSIPVDELEDHEYKIDEPLLTEKSQQHRVVLTKTDNLLPHFVDNLLKYVKK